MKSSWLLLFSFACGSAAAPTTTPREAPAGPAPTFVCEASRARLELSSIEFRESANPGHRGEQRWNDIDADFRLTAGEVEHAGRIRGVRNADAAFIQLQAMTPDNAMEAVHLVVASPDGTEAQLRWSTGVGEEMEDSDVATCTGSLLTAIPAKR